MKRIGGPIDYTNLGYESMREAMLSLARESLPEWTDFSENDLGVLLVELFAYASDVTLYYQTRIASNLFPATSDEPQALVQLLRLIGYELRPPAAATANLTLSFAANTPTPITILEGTKFFVTIPTGEQLTFETEREWKIQDSQLEAPDARGFRYLRNALIPVVEGHTVTEDPVAISDGRENQMYTLREKPVIKGSIEVTVEELPHIETRWQEVDTLANSSPADRHFIVQRNAEGAATILFGDGINGIVPPPGTFSTPVRIKATYRVGGGAKGNVPAATRFNATAPIIGAYNPEAAAGGADSEDTDRARAFAPRLFRTQERAVTVQDYIDLAMQVPGVGKARAVALNWNQVVLYIAPSGQVAEPSELLKRDLLAFFENRRMLTTGLKIFGPQAADIYLGAIVRAKPYYLKSDVRAAVEKAVADYLDFNAVEFGQPIYLSKVYDVIQSLDYVASLTVFKFSRKAEPVPGAAIVYDIEPNGIIELGANELPRPGYRDNPNTPASLEDGTSYRTPIFTIIEGGVGQ